MSNAIKNLIIALGITVVMGGGYLWYTSQEIGVVGDESALLSSGIILEDIRNLETYTLDASFFDSTSFQSLQSYKVVLNFDETTSSGRPNPFTDVD